MIGVFDSGIGGLTVVREIIKQFPGMPVLYLGDTARTPYGNKSPETIQKYALEDAKFLVGQGATILVAACNSASSTFLSSRAQTLRSGRGDPDISSDGFWIASSSGPKVGTPRKDGEFTSNLLPIFEVITPSARRAGALTQKKRIGVIGTRATIGSGAYENAIHAIDPSITVVGQACPLFVPLIEEGWAKKGETTRIVKLSLQGLKTKNIDTLIMGCTHYPIIRDIIQVKIGKRVKLVDPAEEVVKELKRYFDANPIQAEQCRSQSDHRFMVTDVTEHFQSIAQSWLKRSVRLEKVTL